MYLYLCMCVFVNVTHFGALERRMCSDERRAQQRSAVLLAPAPTPLLLVAAVTDFQQFTFAYLCLCICVFVPMPLLLVAALTDFQQFSLKVGFVIHCPKDDGYVIV